MKANQKLGPTDFDRWIIVMYTARFLKRFAIWKVGIRNSGSERRYFREIDQNLLHRREWTENSYPCCKLS